MQENWIFLSDYLTFFDASHMVRYRVIAYILSAYINCTSSLPFDYFLIWLSLHPHVGMKYSYVTNCLTITFSGKLVLAEGILNVFIIHQTFVLLILTSRSFVVFSPFCENNTLHHIWLCSLKMIWAQLLQVNLVFTIVKFLTTGAWSTFSVYV